MVFKKKTKKQIAQHSSRKFNVFVRIKDVLEMQLDPRSGGGGGDDNRQVQSLLRVRWLSLLACLVAPGAASSKLLNLLLSSPGERQDGLLRSMASILSSYAAAVAAASIDADVLNELANVVRGLAMSCVL